jgi:multidrug transporter EmrE-like cation transporter
VPSIIVVGYLASFGFLALVLKSLPVGIVYASGPPSASRWSRS